MLSFSQRQMIIDFVIAKSCHSIGDDSGTVVHPFAAVSDSFVFMCLVFSKFTEKSHVSSLRFDRLLLTKQVCHEGSQVRFRQLVGEVGWHG